MVIASNKKFELIEENGTYTIIFKNNKTTYTFTDKLEAIEAYNQYHELFFV